MMKKDKDIIFMRKALDLAAKGRYTTRPNPMVGAVIVYKDRIIGEGYHHKAGEAHAEVIAVNNAPQELLSESTIYVSLEPCSHIGRTPPCANMLVEKGFKRVVVGALDTSAKVSGRGINILKEAGCDVRTGVLEEECRNLNRRFFTYHELRRPYIILKWAQTADLYIDRFREEGQKQGPNWITGDEEQTLVHSWRAEEHSILVGWNTIINDNPELSVRKWQGENPLRIAITDSEILPAGLKLFEDERSLLLFSTIPHKLSTGKENIVTAKEDMLDSVINNLYDREVQSIIVEGGANIFSQFIAAGLWDEARVFTGKQKFGAGIVAPSIVGKIISEKSFENSKLIYIQP